MSAEELEAQNLRYFHKIQQLEHQLKRALFEMGVAESEADELRYRAEKAESQIKQFLSASAEGAKEARKEHAYQQLRAENTSQKKELARVRKDNRELITKLLKAA